LSYVSDLELATMVREMVGSRAGVVHAPLPKDDPIRRNPNITRAQELLGGCAKAFRWTMKSLILYEEFHGNVMA
jgi:nucleoside-diphosphate-sugar epimerase